jgi:hypothetical protein
MELVRFDTQLMENAEISGVEYQQGTLAGYEIREYLLEKWGRKCAYCGKKDIPLQIEHLVPRFRGGSNRVSNLTLACEKCNQDKGNRTASEYGFPHLMAQAKASLKDVAGVMTTRWALWRALAATGLSLEVGTGGRTKWNRTRLGLSKSHWADAACVGPSTPDSLAIAVTSVLLIASTGHGSRQSCRTNKHGFPIRHVPRQKVWFGFRTGDLVRAVVPKGKYVGVHVGRVRIRTSGSFDIPTARGLAAGISYRYCHIIQRADGYTYATRNSINP